MLRHLLLIFSFTLTTVAFSQKMVTVNGKVIDSAGTALSGASVKWKSGKDSTGIVTDKDGTFKLSLTGTTSFTLEISSINYTRFTKRFNQPAATINAGTIKMVPDPGLLGEVVVSSVNPITVKEDTIEYKASAYKVREGAPVEDVIKKLPDVVVDKDGGITAQGKTVSRVRVNGKDFFGGDVQTATKNLPADIIDNIQIIDDYGDQANLTGIKGDDPEKIININIRRDRNKGYFGSVTAAAGNDERYAGGLVANRFNNEQQISFIGSINNTNSNLFNFGGGGRGGGARGANFGGGERGGFGAGNGITLSKSAGLNYRDAWGKKIQVYGSYSYSGRDNRSISSSESQDINPKNIRFTTSDRTSQSTNDNHRLTFNLEYRMDTANFLKLSPYFSTSTLSSTSQGESSISRPGYHTFNANQNSGNSSAPNGGTDFSFNHRFPKRGRNFNISGTYNYSYRDADQSIYNTYANTDSSIIPITEMDTIQKQGIGSINKNIRTQARVSYTEPIAQGTYLELNYEWNRSATNNEKTVNDIDPISDAETFNIVQSNHFDYQFVTNRIGANIRVQRKKYNYTIGVVSQPSTLSGQSIGKNISTSYHNTNWLPSARFVYKIARGNTFTATLNGSSREPDFFQLQPVADSSNLNNIVIGNPNLQAELTRRLSVQYNKFDAKSGRSLFSNISFDQTDNKIVNSRINNVSGTGRTTTYLNTDGFYNISANGSFTQPFSNRKYSTTLSVFGTYNNNISYTDYQRNKGRNLNIRPSAVFRVDLENIIDAQVNVGYTFYNTTTRYATYTNTTRAKTLNLGVGGKNYFFKDLTLGYDFTKTINYNFSSNVNSNPVILNLYTEYRFLKRKVATIRLQGYDLFNQNTGITRTINETTITDSRTNRLARYFLLTFNLRLQKFSGTGGFQRNQNRQGREEDGQFNRQQGDGQGGGRQNGGGGGFRGGGGGGRNN
jgi:uncharacterized membrane protein YgcG